jgi:hypothetical protein
VGKLKLALVSSLFRKIFLFAILREFGIEGRGKRF